MRRKRRDLCAWHDCPRPGTIAVTSFGVLNLTCVEHAELICDDHWFENLELVPWEPCVDE